jgi:putative transposase
LIVFSRYLARLGALIADTSTSGIRVARELDRLLGERGKPKTIVSDNGTELTSNTILQGPTITRSPGTTSRRASQYAAPGIGFSGS